MGEHPGETFGWLRVGLYDYVLDLAAGSDFCDELELGRLQHGFRVAQTNKRVDGASIAFHHFHDVRQVVRVVLKGLSDSNSFIEGLGRVLTARRQ